MKTLVFICLSLFLTFVPSVFAKEDMGGEILSVSPTVVVAPTQIPDYALPYPGILPSNPLYLLKAFRDKIVSMLIGDPLKKAEFDLLQADKRLNAAVMLSKKDSSGKSRELVISTISKGENYFEEAVSKTIEAKREGRETSDFAKKLFSASQKHEFMLKDLQKQPSFKEDIAPLLSRMDKLQGQVVMLFPQEKKKEPTPSY